MQSNWSYSILVQLYKHIVLAQIIHSTVFLFLTWWLIVTGQIYTYISTYKCIHKHTHTCVCVCVIRLDVENVQYMISFDIFQVISRRVGFFVLIFSFSFFPSINACVHVSVDLFLLIHFILFFFTYNTGNLFFKCLVGKSIVVWSCSK